MKYILALSLIVHANAFSINLRSPVGASVIDGSTAFPRYSRQVRLQMAEKLTNEQFWEQQRRLAGNMKNDVNEKEQEIKL